MTSAYKTHTLALLLVVAYLLTQVIQAYFHARWISSGIWPSHAWSSAIGIGLALAACFLLAVLIRWRWKRIFFFMILLLSLRWIVFDISLNYFRNLPLDYIGLPDRHDAWLDSMPAAWHFGLKAIIFVISLTGFLRTFRK